MARCPLGPIIAPILVGACVAATTTQATHEPTHAIHDASGLRDRRSARPVDGEHVGAEVRAAPPVVPVHALPPAEPVHVVEDRVEPETPAPSLTRVIERARLEARGAARVGARFDAAALRAAVLIDNRAWTADQRRELLAYLRGGVVDAGAQFTDADARIVAQLQAGAGGRIDGVLGDETMAVLLATGFRASARKATPWEVTLEFYPGELEDLDTWKREIEKIAKEGGGFDDVDAPPGEGTIYVDVGGSIVAGYRARGGPPSSLDHGDHVAVPTRPGAYRLGPGHPHVTSNWHYSQIPWGAEIRMHDGGYQYRSGGRTKWSWATPHSDGTLKEPIAAYEFDDLPEVTRAGATYRIWNKNDFGPIAWNLVPSDQFIHTTPSTEAQAAEGAPTSLGFSHGCIHIDPRERDEMVSRGYLGKDIRFVVRRWDEHLLPDELRHEMMKHTEATSAVASAPASSP